MTKKGRSKHVKYRKKAIIVEATQWFQNGDHPLDNIASPESEGKIVKYFRDPIRSGDSACLHCEFKMYRHGWIDTLEGGHIVCPGDWIITGTKGERYPCKPEIFSDIYECVSAQSTTACPHGPQMSDYDLTMHLRDLSAQLALDARRIGAPNSEVRERLSTQSEALAQVVRRFGEYEAEEDSSNRIRATMASILDAVAIALKGPPGDLKAHSWHDLPELARKAKTYPGIADAMAEQWGSLK